MKTNFLAAGISLIALVLIANAYEEETSNNSDLNNSIANDGTELEMAHSDIETNQSNGNYEDYNMPFENNYANSPIPEHAKDKKSATASFGVYLQVIG